MTPSVTLRLAATGILFALLAWHIDLGALASRFADIEPLWALAALGLTVPQVVLSAWRWRLTARRIGLSLGLQAAVREYYLATFLNQVLPGGVLGDATRAWRHARIQTDPGDAWHAVLIERASGQLSLALVTLIALGCAPTLRQGLVDTIAGAVTPAAVVVLIAGLALVVAALCGLGIVQPIWARAAPAARLQRFIGHLRDNLFTSKVSLAQFASSVLVVATYVAVFVLCARAIGVERPLTELWVLVPPVLMVMAIPLSVAGWGLREGAAALVWMLAGLSASEGVAISLAYGAIVLVSSLPGAVVLLMRRSPASTTAGARADA